MALFKLNLVEHFVPGKVSVISRKKFQIYHHPPFFGSLALDVEKKP